MTNPNKIESLEIKAAYSGDEFIGYRIQAGSDNCLVFADQEGWPGIRCGNFTPSFGKELSFKDASIVEGKLGDTLPKRCPQTQKQDCPICGEYLGWIDLNNPSRPPTDDEWQSAVTEMQSKHNKLIGKNRA